jgi:uncharacterized protein (TIGR00297 family)
MLSVRLPLRLALPLSLVGSLAAHRLHALTYGGAAAASAVGSTTLTAGMGHTAALSAFFVTSSFLGALVPGEDSIAAKGGERDALQVVANGGVSAVCAYAERLGYAWAGAAFAGALAAACADTWATEVGRGFGRQPILITSLRRVPPGTSGAISLPGLAASLIGATVIAGIASLGRVVAAGSIPAVALSGTAAALVDSLLGATIQEIRFCPVCGTQTEQTRHTRCGTQTYIVGGLPGIDNDVVNLATTASGALLAVRLARTR